MHRHLPCTSRVTELCSIYGLRHDAACTGTCTAPAEGLTFQHVRSELRYNAYRLGSQHPAAELSPGYAENTQYCLGAQHTFTAMGEHASAVDMKFRLAMFRLHLLNDESCGL